MNNEIEYFLIAIIIVLIIILIRMKIESIKALNVIADLLIEKQEKLKKIETIEKINKEYYDKLYRFELKVNQLNNQIKLNREQIELSKNHKPDEKIKEDKIIIKEVVKIDNMLENKLAELEHSIKLKDDELIVLKNRFDYKVKDVLNLKEEKQKLIECIEKKDKLFDDIKELKDNGVLNIASLIADHKLIQFDISSEYLERKKNPATVEALRIKELRIESKSHLTYYKLMLYKYEALMELFPELQNYVEDFDTIKDLAEFENVLDIQNNFDNALKYLSKEEYLSLDDVSRNQLALDKYIKGNKSNWQVGRDYEMFCGWEYEMNGWKVTYKGMEDKLNDLGRDLIATKGKKHHIIQCKYWKKENPIREKHIVQIFGTAIEYSLNNPNIETIPVLITSTTLSETAIKFARKLNVTIIQEKPLKEFPRIKCNIGKDEYGNETKIYHLPFDQQYDKTRIDQKGEFYAYTVQEAVDNGFRRAFRHFNK